MATARARASPGEAPWWMRTASAIWWPMVSTGFRLVIGSWKIMAMRLPRIARIAPSSRVSRSVPSKCTEPRTVRGSRGGKSRMIESAVTLLPQPDSPTMPSVSPGETSNDTPSTARVTPSSVKKKVARSRTESSGVMLGASPSSLPLAGRADSAAGRAGWGSQTQSSPQQEDVQTCLPGHPPRHPTALMVPTPAPTPPRRGEGNAPAWPGHRMRSHPPRQARVEAVAQAVAEEVHGEHHDGERDAGCEDRPGGAGEKQPRLRDHVAPGRDLGRRARAEEGQRRLDQDRGGADIGRLHDQRRNRVRQDVAQ